MRAPPSHSWSSPAGSECDAHAGESKDDSESPTRQRTSPHPTHRVRPRVHCGDLVRHPQSRGWGRGVRAEGTERVRVSSRDAALVVWSPDYDGKGKAWVRFDDDADAIVGGLRVEREPLQQLVHAREAALRSFLDAVLHGRVALLGRIEAHRLRQLRPVAEILELERLQVVLERLHEAPGWLDLAELALDDAVGGSEPVGAAGADVHLLDDGAVAPPFGDQLRIRPDGVDVCARCVEGPLDADLDLVRGGDGGLVH